MNTYLLDIEGYDAAEAVGTSPATTFTRASSASRFDGSQVGAGVARLETGKLGEALMIEEGTTNLCLIDTETAAGTEFATDGPGTTIAISSSQAFSGSKSISYLYGGTGSRNIYLNGASKFTQTAATKFTMSVKIKYADSTPVTGITGYIYVSSNTNANGACAITPLRDGWYLCTYTRSGLVSGAVSLIGVAGLLAGKVAYLDDWQVEAQSLATSYIFGTRNYDLCTIPTANVISDGKPFTIEAWVKQVLSPFGSVAAVVSDWTRFYLAITSAGALRISYTDGTQQILNSANNLISVGQWYHLALVFDGLAVSGYINGVRVIAPTATTLPVATSGTLKIGNLSSSYVLNGLIDDLRISTVARTEVEIQETVSRSRMGAPVRYDDNTAALYRFDAPGLRILHFCTGPGYIDGDVTYLPRVKQPGHLKSNMFKSGTTGGAGEIGFGDVSLVNDDGVLDYMRNYGFDGRKITLKAVTSADPAVLFTGTMEQPVFNWSLISLVVRDRMALLRIPLQPNKYLGNNALPNGLEGTDDIKGRPKPLLWGEVHNITPVLVNTSKLTYQARDGALYSIPQVYDRGVLLTAGANHATSALLQAATPAAGTYDTCLAEGYFRLGSTPSGEVTCNAVQGTTAADRTVAQIAKQVVTRVIPESDIYAQGILSVDAANSAVIGIYVADETTIDAVLDEICASIGCWYNFDGDGLWNLRQFTAPGNNPIMVLTESDGLTVERMETNDQGRGVPAYKYILEYDRNYTVQTDLAGSSNRLPYTSREYRTATPAVDTAIQSKHLLAPVMQAKSLLISAAAADAEAVRRLALYKQDRDRLEVKCKVEALRYPAVGWWDNNAISDMSTARHGHAAVVHKNYLYVIGGYILGGGRTASVIRLNLDKPSGGWDDAGVTDLPSGRYWHSAVVHGDTLYVVGGYDGSTYRSVIKLDLNNPSGAWINAAGGGIPNMPSDFSQHSAVVHGNYLYVIGGQGFVGATASVIRIDLTNPGAGWDDAGVTNLPAARDLMCAVVYGSYLYVVGGRIADSPSPTTSVIRLDLNIPAGAWDDAGVTDLPVARHGAAAILTGSKVLLLGGFVAETAITTAVLTLDLASPSSSWMSNIAPLPDGRAYASAAVYADSVYLVAGYTGTVPMPNTYRLRTNDNVLDRVKLAEIGLDMALKVNRYNYGSGKHLKIIGAKINYETEDVTLDMWG